MQKSLATRGYSGKALAAVVFWGLSFVATKQALTWLTPIGLVSSRLVIATIALLIITRVAGAEWAVQRGDRTRCVLLGIILAVHLLIQSLGLLRTTATNTGWIIAFCPITIALGAFMFLRERITLLGWSGIGIGTAGVMLVCGTSELHTSESVVGDLLQVLSCCTWAAFTLLAVGPILRNGSQRVTLWTVGASAGAILPLATVQPLIAGPASWRSWAAVAFLGVVCSGLASWLWYGAVRRIGSTAAGTYLYIEPFVTWAAASIMAGERFRWLVMFGGVVVLAGVWTVGFARRSSAGGHPST